MFKEEIKWYFAESIKIYKMWQIVNVNKMRMDQSARQQNHLNCTLCWIHPIEQKIQMNSSCLLYIILNINTFLFGLISLMLLVLMTHFSLVFYILVISARMVSSLKYFRSHKKQSFNWVEICVYKMEFSGIVSIDAWTNSLQYLPDLNKQTGFRSLLSILFKLLTTNDYVSFILFSLYS